mgnify:CR=1 FL=1
MNPVTKYIIAALIGSSVGFIGGLQGIAGGFYISMLLLATGLVETQRMAAGTTLLAIVFPLSIGAVYEYYKAGEIDTIPGLIITFFYIIFATIGARYNSVIDEKWIVLSLGSLLMLTSFYFFNKYYKIKN